MSSAATNTDKEGKTYLKEEREVLLSCKAFGLVHTCDAKMQNATQMQALGLEFFFLGCSCIGGGSNGRTFFQLLNVV